METYEKFEKLVEILGTDEVLKEVVNYFSTKDIEDFVDSVATDHDIVVDEDEMLETIFDEVENWFCNYCGEDGYDSSRDRIRDLEAMADYANDPMVDHCIEEMNFVLSFDCEEYRDKIESKLAELASNEI